MLYVVEKPKLGTSRVGGLHKIQENKNPSYSYVSSKKLIHQDTNNM